MLPESRKEQGLFMERSVRENATIAVLPEMSPGGVVDTRRERQVARDAVREVDVRTRSLEAPVVTLSGGNQQKVLFAKWLLLRPKILLADEPTRGVDVGAIAEIHEIINGLADQGKGVVVISSYLPEILALSDRILVARQGKIVEEFSAAEADEKRIMYAAIH